MKLRWKIGKSDNLREWLRRNKLIFLSVAAGILLLIWPTGERKSTRLIEDEQDCAAESFSVRELEERLEEVLSKVEGAGEVSVILTVRTGTERIFASDRYVEETQSGLDREEKVVIVSGEEGEEALLIGENYPVFHGALLICPGGDDPQIRLRLTQAVAVLTGLGADRIAVCKGVQQ